VIERDADYDLVLATAVTGRADLIASGDKRHVLPLGSYQGIPIVSARDAVQQVRVRGNG
jgi:uncharacterized protein